MSFEKEREFMIEALENNYTFDAEHIQEELDNLYDLFRSILLKSA